MTTVEAKAGSACTAQVTYTVLAAGATPPPAPEPETPSVTNPTPAPPRTDAAFEIGSTDTASGASLWLLGLALLGVGSTGLYWTRAARRP